MVRLLQKSDEGLIALAQTGDKQAVDTLILRYYPLVAKLASAFGGKVEREDLMQEGFIGLLSAIRTYNSDRGVAFKTYATTCIHNRICNAVKFALRDKDKTSIACASMDDSDFTGFVSSDFDPQLLLISKEKIAEMRSKIQSLLSTKEREVLQLYLSGHSYDEIARILTYNYKSVDNALQRVRKKLKKL